MNKWISLTEHDGKEGAELVAYHYSIYTGHHIAYASPTADGEVKVSEPLAHLILSNAEMDALIAEVAKAREEVQP